MLHSDLKSQLKDAMKAKEVVRLGVIRNMLTAFTNELVATKRTPQEELPDEEALIVVKRLSRQRKDSIEQFRAGGREDLAQKEEAELAVLKEYLPDELDEEEIEKIAKTKKGELGITERSQVGRLIGALMRELKGKADGAVVRRVVEKLFN